MIAVTNNTNVQKTVFISLFCCIIFLLSKNIGFFWDNTLLASKMGHYMFENNLFVLNFPENFDPGHPPLISFILAVTWSLFGKNLFASHLIMLPFLFGLIWQLHNFSCYFFTKKWQQIVAVSFVFCDPTILAQTFFIGQEVPQIFFFLLALNQLFKDKYILKTVALMLLGLCSIRGMMLCGGFFLIDFFYCIKIKKQPLFIFRKENIITYALAAMPSIVFIIWRITAKGYFLMHPNSPWKDLAHFVNLKEFAFNVIVVIHRFSDFGRIAILIFIGYSILHVKKTLKQDAKVQLLFAISFLSTVIIVIVSLAITNTIGHRYFTISFLILHLLCVYIILNFFSYRKILITSLIIILITGNFWQYPQRFAQGWDASLRGVPYFDLRNQAIKYLQTNKINHQEVGTFFPNIYSNEEINLNGDTTCFAAYDGRNKYVFFANIYNQKPELYTQILNNYTLLKRFEKSGIFVEIYNKK